MSGNIIKAVGAIELTADERALLSQIEFDVLAIRDHDAVISNGERAYALTKAVLARDAIPEARLKWFVDPEYNIGGRGSSRRQIFERNGTCGDDIFRHPHFLPYLGYFINGARLPGAVTEAFVDEVERCGQITSGDVVPLGKFARAQARRHRLGGREAAEEFYKLALDCGLWPLYARSIRDAVQRLR